MPSRATTAAVHARRSDRPGASRTLFAAVVPLAVLLALTACVGGSGQAASPAASDAAPSSSASAAPSAGAIAATLVPDGSAADNKPFFDEVNQALIAQNPAAGGVEITSNLRDKGFDIAAMQVTPDITTVGVAADSIQFSVKWGDDCLIGQYGQGHYQSIVAPALGTGACLVGTTRPIDW